MTEVEIRYEHLEPLWETVAGQTRTLSLPLDATITPRTLTGEGGRTASSLPYLSLSSERGVVGGRHDLEVLRTLGEGGMGRVELARQRSLGREVALKTLKPGKETQRAVASLLHEARCTGSLEHPNIIPIHALGLDDEGRPALVMKRVEGVNWREMIMDGDHPGWARVSGDRLEWHLEVLMQVCHAAHFAHSRRIVHRDIKPENVMIGEFGEVYLLDWGVALDLDAEPPERPGELVGTPVYLAPEMTEGSVERVGPQTDVFLLGATLHEILTGAPPHEGARMFDVLLAAYRSEPKTYSSFVPDELAEICRRAMDRDPDKRMRGAVALREAIDGFLGHRASAGLSAAAAAHLSAMEAIVASGARDPGAEAALADRFSASRFGFQQAIEDWEGNREAHEGLQRALELMIGFAIDRRRPHDAELLLNQLPNPNPSLSARLQALSGEIEVARREVEALRHRDHERDAKVGAAQRGRFALIIGSLWTLGLLTSAVLTSQGWVEVTTAHHAASILGLVLPFVVVLYVGRKALLHTQIDRRLMGMVGLALAAMEVLALLCWFVDIEVHIALAFDALVVAMVIGATAILIEPRLWLAAAPFLLVTFINPLWPDLAHIMLAIATFVSNMTMSLIWRLTNRRAQAQARALANGLDEEPSYLFCADLTRAGLTRAVEVRLPPWLKKAEGPP